MRRGVLPNTSVRFTLIGSERSNTPMFISTSRRESPFQSRVKSGRGGKLAAHPAGVWNSAHWYSGVAAGPWYFSSNSDQALPSVRPANTISPSRSRSTLPMVTWVSRAVWVTPATVGVKSPACVGVSKLPSKMA
ncbi:MAG: hypothetical protein IPJ65_41440 [Archangiaceae bacterium]|nr:hypothetical protein [Archangiaceae bacterium]